MNYLLMHYTVHEYLVRKQKQYSIVKWYNVSCRYDLFKSNVKKHTTFDKFNVL